MVDNRGNAYRTRGAITAAIVLIGAVVAMLAYFAAGLGALTAAVVALFLAVPYLREQSKSSFRAAAKKKGGDR